MWDVGDVTFFVMLSLSKHGMRDVGSEGWVVEEMPFSDFF